MPKIETLLEKEKFRKSSFRPWNFLEGLEQIEAKENQIKWELEQSNGNSDAIKGELPSHQIGTKGELKWELEQSNGNSDAIKWELGSDRVELSAQLAQKEHVKWEPEVPVPILDTPVPISNRSSSHLNLGQFPFENTPKWEPELPVPISNPPGSHLQIGTVNQAKWELLPQGNQEKLILLFLAEKQAKNGGQHTPRIRRLDISIGYDLPLHSVQTQVKRLIKKGYVELVDGKRGRGKSGCVYRIPPAISTAILGCKENLKGNRKWEPNGNQMGTGSYVSSSSNLNSTTTTNSAYKMFLKKLSSFSDRIGLADFDIGINDLVTVWRTGVFESEQEFLESIEHMAFYLDLPESKTLTAKKAWAMKELKKGYYARPAKFESSEERYERLKLEAAQAKNSNLQELKKKRLEAEFEVWFEELLPEQLREYLKPYPAISNLNSLMAKEMLFDVFTKQGHERKEKVQEVFV
jgi:hypothetical protein